MDTAVDLTGDVDCMDDGTWSYTWSWRYAGDTFLADVNEEFFVVNSNGIVIDFKQEPHHTATPDETQIGGGLGHIPLPPGNYIWKLHVLSGGGIIGLASGEFFAATNPGGDLPGPGPLPPQPGGGEHPPQGEVREPTLRRGDKSADGWVEYLQELLNGYGFPLVIDGDFGGATYGAVRGFQDQRHLKVDGIVGNQTWAALRLETPQDPGTDGRKRHSYVEQGAAARWWTEMGPGVFDPGEDSIVLTAVNTGRDPLGFGFVAAATLTPIGSAPIPFELHSFTGDGAPAGPGFHVLFGNRGIAALTGQGDVVIDALLPPELGGDNIQVTVTVP